MHLAKCLAIMTEWVCLLSAHSQAAGHSQKSVCCVSNKEQTEGSRIQSVELCEQEKIIKHHFSQDTRNSCLRKHSFMCHNDVRNWTIAWDNESVLYLKNYWKSKQQQQSQKKLLSCPVTNVSLCTIFSQNEYVHQVEWRCEQGDIFYFAPVWNSFTKIVALTPRYGCILCILCIVPGAFIFTILICSACFSLLHVGGLF